jgi:hypothetical protein
MKSQSSFLLAVKMIKHSHLNKHLVHSKQTGMSGEGLCPAAVEAFRTIVCEGST